MSWPAHRKNEFRGTPTRWKRWKVGNVLPQISCNRPLIRFFNRGRSGRRETVGSRLAARVLVEPASQVDAGQRRHAGQQADKGKAGQYMISPVFMKQIPRGKRGQAGGDLLHRRVEAH